MKKDTVVVVLSKGCSSFEVSLVSELLSKKFELIIASCDGKDVPTNSGLPIKVQKSFIELDLSNCKAIIVPGEASGCEQLLKEANQKNILIGRIGSNILEDSDVLLTIKENIILARPEAHIDFAVEIACRLDVVDAARSGRLKEYYRGTLGRRIRPLALALIKNERGQLLLHQAFDRVKNEVFYRPLGGGIEFHETGEAALEREFMEEVGSKIVVGDLVHTFENIFTYEGHRGHEIVLLYEAKFEDDSMYQKSELDIVESGKVISKAVWRSLEEIQLEKAKIYPSGIEKGLL